MSATVTVTPISETLLKPDISTLPSITNGTITDVVGGFEVTGFVDVEKLISFTDVTGAVRTLFLEKKLPYQILVLDIDPE